MRFLLIIAALLTMPLSTPAHAWGDQGHHLTCQIAYDLLTPVAKQKVDALLSSQGETYKKLARACTYPDKVKATDGKRDWHYVNLHRDDGPLAGIVCPIADTPTACLLAAIQTDLATVGDASKSNQDRGKALMYLGHWLGDLHQPLHVSYKDDIGGGYIETTGFCAPSEKLSNLHSIWDTCVIVQRIFAERRRPRMVDDPRFYSAANRLRLAVSDSDRTTWQAGEPWSWANESYAIALTPAVNYCVKQGATCRYSSASERRPYGPGTSLKRIDIDAEYLDYAEPIVTERLQRGGIRLAHLLNRALDPAYTE